MKHLLLQALILPVAAIWCFLVWLKDFLWNHWPMTWLRVYLAVVITTTQDWVAIITNEPTHEEQAFMPSNFEEWEPHEEYFEEEKK